MAGVSSVLLAAGESTRMGQPKALLDWHGLPLIIYQARALLEGGVSELVVVLGHQASRLLPLIPPHPQVGTVLNRRYRTGKTSSIKTGLRHISPQAEGVIIVGVDQPRKWQTYARMLEAFRERATPLVVPAYNAQRGHPPLFSRVLFKELMAISEAGQGLREVVERHKGERMAVEVDDPLVRININTHEEYQEALRLAKEH